MDKESIISLDIELRSMQEDITATTETLDDLMADAYDQRQTLNDLICRVQKLADVTGMDIPKEQLLEIRQIKLLNEILDDSAITKTQQHSRLPGLSKTDIIISSVTGFLAAAIDIMLAGTPEVVKVYKGGERFDGSILTAFIRKLSNGTTRDLFNQLSRICKVPYDVSAFKGSMYPQNHRLRSLGHDPFFGLFFAVFDITMNTTTFIDNDGFLRVIPNTRFSSSPTEKMLPVIYYIGHIISLQREGFLFLDFS